MYKPYYLLVAGILSLFSLTRCNHTDTSNAVFKPDALQPFTVEIDVSRDTVLRAPEGSLVHIPANALDAGGAASVKLVIREALHMSDMIRTGLLTVTSSGNILSSGGMINIEPAKGQTVTVKKPISISIPTQYIDEKMQLYKGTVNANGNISWKDPQPLASDSAMKALDEGNAIFTTNCASCHGIGKVVLGPDLAYISQRRDWKWLYSFTKNNKTVLASGDRYTHCLYEQYNRTQMNTFSDLTDKSMRDLYRFIDNESYKHGLPMPDDRLYHCTDSCALYESKRDSLLNKRRALVKDNGPRIVLRQTMPAGYINPDTVGVVSKVVAPVYQAEYFQFEIKSFGWYNIDRLLQDVKGVVAASLFARIPPQYKTAVNVFLAIPSVRVLQEGGPSTVGDSLFAFYDPNGRLPLPQNAKGILVALGEKDGQPIGGTATFRCGVDQVVDLSIHPFSKDELNEYLHQLDLRDISVIVNDAKNATEIRQTDRQLKDIEKLKPTGCDCNCTPPAQQIDTIRKV
ncbi:MAG: cytochrome c [Chitinophagaceae bacterium]|nr:cytochrome c [Chitinophagaceae bacterium]